MILLAFNARVDWIGNGSNDLVTWVGLSHMASCAQQCGRFTGSYTRWKCHVCDNLSRYTCVYLAVYSSKDLTRYGKDQCLVVDAYRAHARVR